jgi:hypothetical protein
MSFCVLFVNYNIELHQTHSSHVCKKIKIFSIKYFFPTLVPLSGVGTTSCCNKQSAVILTSGRLTSTLLKTGVGADDCKCSWDHLNRTGLSCLRKHGRAWDNKFCPLQTLLSFCDRTPSALTRAPSSSSKYRVSSFINILK